MIQALYAHMNNKTIIIIKKARVKSTVPTSAIQEFDTMVSMEDTQKVLFT
jgi:hypothetical protein